MILYGARAALTVACTSQEKRPLYVAGERAPHLPGADRAAQARAEPAPARERRAPPRELAADREPPPARSAAAPETQYNHNTGGPTILLRSYPM